VCNTRVSLHALHARVRALGGFEVVTAARAWRRVAAALGLPEEVANVSTKLKQAYQKYLAAYDIGNGTLRASALLSNFGTGGLVPGGAGASLEGGSAGGGALPRVPSTLMSHAPRAMPQAPPRREERAPSPPLISYAPPPMLAPAQAAAVQHAAQAAAAQAQAAAQAAAAQTQLQVGVLLGLERQTVRCGASACAKLLTIPLGSERFKCGTCGTLQSVPKR
jgi:hypothetical protein